MEVPKETAMQLYNLEHLELVRDPLTSTKCLVAWGQDTVLVAFRGTANKQNAIHDLKVGSPLGISRPCSALHLVLVTKKGMMQKKGQNLAAALLAQYSSSSCGASNE